jgi:pimeloyl-ACP methyl ester carboxylesterase
MQAVISQDGTAIAFTQSGRGPTVLIVGGSLADHHFYEPLANALAADFTVINFDRRGRGQSGDTQPYAVAREIEDVAALIAHAHGPVSVYGHSAGAALALRAAAAGLNMAKLVLADPPFTPSGDDDAAAAAEFAKEAAHIQKLHDLGDHRGSARFFLGGFGLSEADVEEMLQSPAGDSLISSARALPYDYAMLGDGLVPAALAELVKIPTTILATSAMPETAQALGRAIPGARVELLDAPTHAMMPDQLASVLRQLLG